MAKKKPQLWPADQVERRPIGELTPYANNPRTHSAAQIKQIAASIQEWGWTMPVLVDEAGELIAGHGRIMAAQLLGLTEVPVMVARGWSAAQKRAYVIADNAIAINGSGWDDNLLRLELGDLAKLDFNLNLVGFDDVRLATFGVGAAAGQSDPDEELQPEAIPISQRGDVWLLGKHRIICGDSTDKDDVAAVLGKDKPHLMVTDPPYGVDYNPAWRHTAKRSNGERLSTGMHSMGKVINDDRSDWSAAWVLFGGDVAYVWHSGLHGSSVQGSLESAGFQMRSQIIWNKNVMIISRGHYHFKHEPCWYAVRKGAPNARWSGDRSQTSVWDIPIVHATAGDPNDGKNCHGTQKPVECMKRPIENNSKQGDYVYDPFVGSFTTGIACEMTGRSCLAIEISEIYVDLAIRRWEKFTGKSATLQRSKRTFAQIEKERALGPIASTSAASVGGPRAPRQKRDRSPAASLG